MSEYVAWPHGNMPPVHATQEVWVVLARQNGVNTFWLPGQDAYGNLFPRLYFARSLLFLKDPPLLVLPSMCGSPSPEMPAKGTAAALSGSASSVTTCQETGGIPPNVAAFLGVS